MDAEFWRRRWEANEIGFHEGAPNALLVAHHAALALATGSRIFLPLCGKTRDIGWWLAQGHRVVGSEWSRLAVEQLFAELAIDPVVSDLGGVTRFRAGTLDILQGDVFDVSATMLGRVDAVYDRAALVALPADVRGRYAAHVTALSSGAPQLLVCFEYDQALVAGPPFSVGEAEVRRLYEADGGYRAVPLETRAVERGLKGVPAAETIWLLSPVARASAVHQDGIPPQR